MNQIKRLKRTILIELAIIIGLTLGIVFKPPVIKTITQYETITLTREIPVEVPVEVPVVLGEVESVKDNPIIEVVATAYDLSVQSCGKTRTHKAFGITSRGIDLKGKNWKTARVIAVDPKVIPLDSKVEVTFLDPNYAKYNGVYIAGDTGSKIKGNRIDVFIEDTGDTKVSEEALNFGVTKAYVRIVNEGEVK